MVDSLLWHRSGTVIFVPSTATPANGGVVRFFDAGTNNPRTVYTDATLSTGVTTSTLDTNGVCEDIWLPTGSFKYTIETSGGTVFATHDNQLGATDSSSYLTGTVSPARAVISKSSAYTTVADDHGKQINANATGGDFTITLDSAVDYADGGDQLIKNIGESGIVTVAAAGGQTIDADTSFVIGPQNSAVVRSDGSVFYIAESYSATDNQVTVAFDPSITLDLYYPSGTNFLITATANFTLNNPTSPRPGTFFTVTVVQNATGGWEPTFGSNFQDKPRVDIGANDVSVLGFHVRDASTIDGWNLSSQSGWDYIVHNEQTSGTDGGDLTLGAWTDAVLNTVDTTANRFGLAAPSSNQFTLPPGVWDIEWEISMMGCNEGQTRLYDNTGAAVLALGSVIRSSSSDSTNAWSKGFVRASLSVATTVSVQYQVTTTQATNGQGDATSFGVERYGNAKARKIASL